MYCLTACNNVYRKFGFKKDSWEDVQFKTDFMDRNRDYKKGDSFSAEYVFYMNPGVDTKDMQLVVESAHLYEVSVNGLPVHINGNYWLDRDFKCFDIASKVKEGRNVIRLYVEKFNVLCELAPVYILEDFSLKSEDKGWSMVPSRPLETGDWFTQGMPFYPGNVAYTRKVRVDRCGDYKVVLPEWNGTVADVLVGGKSAGVITNRPYTQTVLLSEGAHEISVVVYGSLKSVFGPYHIHTDGYLRPSSFFVGKEQPAGKNYYLPQYGLMEDFSIYRIKE